MDDYDTQSQSAISLDEQVSPVMDDVPADTLESLVGTDYFQALVRDLVSFLGTDCAFVGEFVDESRSAIRTIAVWMDGQPGENFSYDLMHTPCSDVLDSSTCTITRDIQELYPRDLLLQEMGIDAYVGAPLQDASGKAYGIVVVLNRTPISDSQSITALFEFISARTVAEIERARAVRSQEAAQAALVLSEQRLQQAQQLALIGYWEYIVDTGAVTWSKELLDICGLSVEDEVNSGLAFSQDMVHESDRDRVRRLARGVLKGDVHRGVEFKIDRPDGDITHLRTWAGSSEKDAKGRPKRIIVAAQDVTEQKRLEGQFFQSQKMDAIGQLTGGIAHDFNNLLAAILMNAEMLSSVGGEQVEFADQIIKAANRGADLTHRLLAYSRQQILTPQPVDLGGLVEGMADLLGRTLGEHIDIQLETPGNIIVLADPSQLESALLNLAINARDSMETAGRLSLACYFADEEGNKIEPRDSDQAHFGVLSVSDNGSGIPPEVKAKVFEPFFTTKEIGKGNGLGLATVYGFVKQSGGQIDLESELGEGTTVKLSLLLSADSLKEAAAGSHRSGSTSSKGRILVIEDDLDVRLAVKSALDQLGYGVEMAEDVSAARKQFEKDPSFDIVLSDVVLPGGMSGPDYAEELAHDYPDLRIIFMSGYTAEETGHEQLMQAGHLLTKPFTMRKLRDALS